MDAFVLNVRSYTALDIAVTSEEGDKINQLICASFEKNTKVVVDFQGIRAINTAFLNSAIGKLYASYDSLYLNENLTVANISDSDLAYLKKSIEAAKDYYRDPKIFEKSVREATGDDQQD